MVDVGTPRQYPQWHPQQQHGGPRLLLQMSWSQPLGCRAHVGMRRPSRLGRQNSKPVMGVGLAGDHHPRLVGKLEIAGEDWRRRLRVPIDGNGSVEGVGDLSHEHLCRPLLP